jgi:hypothetical protein
LRDRDAADGRDGGTAAGTGLQLGLYLWVVEWNVPAQRFYEALGGCAAERALADDDHGGTVPTVRYVWPQAGALAGRLPTA